MKLTSKRRRELQSRSVIGAFVDIASALCVIFTLGYWYPHWSLNIRARWMRKDINKIKRLRKERQKCL